MKCNCCSRLALPLSSKLGYYLNATVRAGEHSAKLLVRLPAGEELAVTARFRHSELLKLAAA